MNTARRDVRNLFDLFNVHIRKDALDYLTEATKDQTTEERKKYISNLINRLKSDLSSIPSLDLSTLKALILTSRKDVRGYQEDFHVINMPTEFYHRLNSKTNVLEQIKRDEADELKSTNSLQRRFINIMNSLDQSIPSQSNIKPVEFLFSESICKATILATARRVGGDSILAEDLTGAISIEFAGTKMNGWIPFEGGYFLFQGQQMDGIFTVDDVHLPIPKPFSQMPSLTKNDLFNRQKFAEAAESDKIVVLSDIWLDLEEVFVGLSNLFVHFAENPPVMFIFCGTFHSLSVGINYLPTEVENFRKLARLINDYSSTFPETKFVFVPSSDDFPSTPILPKSPFLPSIQQVFANCRNIYFATNPCRILYKNRVITVFRDNVVWKIARSSLCAHRQNLDIVQSYVDSIWSQRHLVPVLPSISPTIPHWDDTLLLQFNPDLLITADTFMPFIWNPNVNKSASKTINPGSFGVNNSRAMLYWPRSQRVELIEIGQPQ